MTTITVTPQDYRSISTPDLVGGFAYSQILVGHLLVQFGEISPIPTDAAEHARAVEELIAWVTDSEGMDWDLIERYEDWDQPNDS